MNKIKFIGYAVKWFDRVNGNTYHSVNITNTKTGEKIYCPLQYGYGNQYQQTGLEAMKKRGWIDGDIWLYERNNNYPIEWIAVDGLKRDCIANGRE